MRRSERSEGGTRDPRRVLPSIRTRANDFAPRAFLSLLSYHLDASNHGRSVCDETVSLLNFSAVILKKVGQVGQVGQSRYSLKQTARLRCLTLPRTRDTVGRVRADPSATVITSPT